MQIISKHGPRAKYTKKGGGGVGGVDENKAMGGKSINPNLCFVAHLQASRQRHSRLTEHKLGLRDIAKEYSIRKKMWTDSQGNRLGEPCKKITQKTPLLIPVSIHSQSQGHSMLTVMLYKTIKTQKTMGFKQGLG